VRSLNRIWTLIIALSSVGLALSTTGLLRAADLPPGYPPPGEPGSAMSTEVLVRVVAHGGMVLGDDVGGARITITEVATGQILASGLQHGDAGDQTQIMRTPRLMEEPQYSSRPSAFFRATLPLERPTLVDITAQGPLSYPWAIQRASKTVLLIPGLDMKNDGIVLHLYGFIVQIEEPKPGTPLTAKDDVTVKASVRTLSGSLVRPHGDWDSRKVKIYAEVLVGQKVTEQFQLFYSGERSRFEGPFFVPLPNVAPNGLTLRVVAADESGDHFGLGEATYPVLPERLRPAAR